MSSPGADAQATLAQPIPWIADYAELTKPRVTALILMSTLVGFVDFSLLLHTLLGTALVAGGTAALNQYWERDTDGKMLRTKDRPLPAGRLEPWKALCFGLVLSAAGILYLGAKANVLSGLLASVTLVTYLFLYTPLKKRTPLCTLVGSFPGAIPPLIGWVAARGEFTLGAGILAGARAGWRGDGPPNRALFRCLAPGEPAAVALRRDRLDLPGWGAGVERGVPPLRSPRRPRTDQDSGPASLAGFRHLFAPGLWFNDGG
ncbi:MAG: ctaB [Acidobacteria bacterium]|nr:ctaB [Acidobacteriota bacterium]